MGSKADLPQRNPSQAAPQGFKVINKILPDNAYLYYSAVIARNIEGDESDAAIPGLHVEH